MSLASLGSIFSSVKWKGTAPPIPVLCCSNVMVVTTHVGFWRGARNEGEAGRGGVRRWAWEV